jgi:hypothetical protein
MTLQATRRKIKRSFTLTSDSLAFVSETRRRRKAASDSEALDLLLRDAMLARKREEIDLAFSEYYDSLPEKAVVEEREWAAMAGRSAALAPEAQESGS